MIKKITFIFSILITSLSFGQTVVNDFEAGSPAIVTRYNAGATSFFVEANPNTTGNTSANVGRVIRNSGNWFELFGFDLASPYTVAAGETKYLHVYVNYPAQPDVSVRMNSVDASADGGPDVRALNAYTDFGQWQDLVFQLDGGTSGITVNSILMLPDLGFQNDPVGQILNNTDAFAFVDNFRFTDSETPEVLSVNNFELDNSISLYPNPARSTFTISTKENITIDYVSIFNILGERVAQSAASLNNQYDVSGLASGLYVIRITDDKGGFATKKLMKK